MSKIILIKPCQQLQINELLFNSPIELIELLELYLNEQITSSSSSSSSSNSSNSSSSNLYDYIANKTLLKLYNCYSEYYSINSIINILLLTLYKLEFNHFQSLISFISIKIINNNEILKEIIQFGNLLENGKFIEFWNNYNINKNHLNNNLNLEYVIRNYIFKIIKLTYHDITIEQLSLYLGLNENDLNNYLGSTSEYFEINGSVVKLAPPENSIITGSKKNNKENLPFEEALRLLDAMKSTSRLG